MRTLYWWESQKERDHKGDKGVGGWTILEWIFERQDGMHWSLDVGRSLNITFQDRWIGRGGPIRWPPRSPDLTPFDFFLWGYVKDRVFVLSVNDLPDLRVRIRETTATVPMNMLERMWQEIEYRLDIVRATNGAHVEVY
ncbi:hypothetical protein B7P43_G07629 [Cryptotermes secundus]|uniref:Tc1-like transposase DDE domain-containing protein n=1 Tax=Cryptotermes secundus TaxID=105785 RepID=A0A2J7RLD5_9NEOP|nr:hypothetical protein B7P43_G07629 [Cryptotermes secundus]